MDRIETILHHITPHIHSTAITISDYCNAQNHFPSNCEGSTSVGPIPNRVCLVVGAGPGIGFSVGKKFAKEGFVVCLARRRLDKLDPFIKEIQVSPLISHINKRIHNCVKYSLLFVDLLF
jgi:hypothetical protein